MAAPTRGQDQSAIRIACVAVEVGAAAAVIAAAVALPWARYRVRGAHTIVSLHAGGLATALVAIGAAGVVLAAAQIRWRTMALAGAEIIVGVAALVLSVLTAAGRISHANSITLTPGGTTAFAAGAGLALVAGLAMTGAAVALLVHDSPRPPESEVDRPVPVGPYVDPYVDHTGGV